VAHGYSERMSQPRPVPTFARSLTQAALTLLCATALGIAACGGGGGGGGGGDATLGNERPLDSSQPASATGRATMLAAGLNAPWGLAFLPDGRMLVTEKGGSVALVSATGDTVQTRLTGPPGVYNNGQGGLLDVALDPDFNNSRWVFFTFAEAGSNSSGTALARGQLNAAYDGWDQSPQVIWRQTPKLPASIHYGSRIAFRTDGTLYLTAGERGVEETTGVARTDDVGVQSTANTIGKVVRLNRDGTTADGSTFGIWSTGHRNPQGAVVRPGSNDLWITEHGPQGGDELNAVAAGGNYGWPVKSYGCPYNSPVGDACRIGGGTHAPSYLEPKSIWVPTSTAPSGLMFYTGDQFPEWKGNVFSGALAGLTLWRTVLDGNGNAVSRQEITAVKALGARIRDVRQGPDGNIYLLTDGSGNNASKIVRLEP
jgi:aldose sugar dehydrogenase